MNLSGNVNVVAVIVGLMIASAVHAKGEVDFSCDATLPGKWHYAYTLSMTVADRRVESFSYESTSGPYGRVCGVGFHAHGVLQPLGAEAATEPEFNFVKTANGGTTANSRNSDCTIVFKPVRGSSSMLHITVSGCRESCGENGQLLPVDVNLRTKRCTVTR